MSLKITSDDHEIIGLQEQFRHHILSLNFNKAAEAVEAGRSLGKGGWADRANEALRFNQNSAEFSPNSYQESAELRASAGVWSYKFERNGILLEGQVFDDVGSVAVFVENYLVKIVNTHPFAILGIKASKFKFFLRNSCVRNFPNIARLGVGCASGPLVLGGDASLGQIYASIRNSQATGNIFRMLGSGYFIDKYGELAKLLTARAGWIDAILDAYVEFREYFEETFGYKLFIFYGTLLGYEREQGFIARDSDFDAAYLSRERTPEAVKAERIFIMNRLARDGRSFKIEPDFFKIAGVSPNVGAPELFFDVFPAWENGGKVWVPNTTCISGDRNLFEPIREVTFYDRAVYVPNKPAEILQEKYGAGWRVPDPGYSPKMARDAAPALARAQLSEAEMAELESACVRARSQVGNEILEFLSGDSKKPSQGGSKEFILSDDRKFCRLVLQGRFFYLAFDASVRTVLEIKSIDDQVLDIRGWCVNVDLIGKNPADVGIRQIVVCSGTMRIPCEFRLAPRVDVDRHFNVELGTEIGFSLKAPAENFGEEYNIIIINSDGSVGCASVLRKFLVNKR